MVYDATSSANSTWDITADIGSINSTGYSGLITASATLKVSGAVTFAASTFAHGNQKVIFDGVTATITTNGNPFYQLDILDTSTPTYTLADDITVNNTLTINNSANAAIITINGNSINAKGDVATGATNRSVNGTTNLKINGSGNQTVTMTFFTTSSLGLPFSIASTGGTVTLAGATFKIGNSWTHISGTVDAGTSTIWFFDTVSVTSNTMEFNNVEFQNTAASKTLTLNDTLTINGNLNTNLGTSSAVNYTINGGTINLKGNLSSGGTERTTTGTATLAIVGTVGTQTIVWTAYSTNYFGLNLTFNSSSTIQFGATFKYGAGTMTYTAGTMDFSTNSNLMTINASCNLNLGTAQLYQLTIASGNTATLTGNLSLANTLTITGTLSAGSNTITCVGNWTKTGTFTAGTSTVVFNGTSTLAGATAFYSLTINAGKTVHLTSTQTFSTNASGTFTATGGTNTLDATTGGSRANFNVAGAQSVGQLAATDIDSSGGNQVLNYVGGAGTISNTVNWTITESSIKTIDGLVYGSVKTVDALATASIKTFNGLA